MGKNLILLVINNSLAYKLTWVGSAGVGNETGRKQIGKAVIRWILMLCSGLGIM